MQIGLLSAQGLESPRTPLAMPRRDDIKSILILGSGPIIIGQACEFDYSGTQACKALRKEGYRIILLNSNPATIMTDPELADATYVEPLTVEIAEKIIALERPNAVLPTVGGQTALNLSIELHEKGIFNKYNVELLGASIEAIHRAESRQEFKAAIEEIGLRVPTSAFCKNMAEAHNFCKNSSLPLIIRPSFTLGGTGGGIAWTQEEFERIASAGLNSSPTTEILVEENVLGWKEFELEVMRDKADNVVIICSIENLDTMGIHTGDSITVAPQQSLSDRQYQKMRNAAIAIIRKIGVATGGSNIQFAVNPKNGAMIVIEMNPRVSRSSALASKATGFPIAKIAALLAVGYTLDEIQNEITQVTPCSFEPSIDYVVTKVPRFTFEKFPENEDTLDTMMRSVGETMSIGRTFKESLQKALRSLEISRYGLGSDGFLKELYDQHQGLSNDKASFFHQLEESLRRPNPQRIFDLKTALYWGTIDTTSGFSIKRVNELSNIDPWFLYQILDLIRIEQDYIKAGCPKDKASLTQLKANGYSDRQIAFMQNKEKILAIVENTDIPEHLSRKQILQLLKKAEQEVYQERKQAKLLPIYKRVDTCAGEFESYTPYLYSTYEQNNEAAVTNKKKVVILGGGPNRIGQGVEFDYCCCHASFALQEMEIESIMINCNPETVSTDYDTSTKLYFEPLTIEDVLHICTMEKPDGIIVSFGGQTPLSLAKGIAEAGLNILGSSPEAIDRAEDRDRFSELLTKLNLNQSPGGLAHTVTEAIEIADRINYPVIVRPSYVLSGRAMTIVYTEDELKNFMQKAAHISPEHPILIDRFIENAIELDVDALSDGEDVFVAGIMQHIEKAGVHSGDSACMLPPLDLPISILKKIHQATCEIALELQIIGFINIQFALSQDKLYVIEVNPRASRTVPFVSKAIGMPLAKLGTQIMCGDKIKDLNIPIHLTSPDYYLTSRNTIAVKEAVLPFARFPASDIILGPEMKSTGEVMGIARSIGQAYIKAQIGAGERIPQEGNVFFSVADEAKALLIEEARILTETMGFVLYCTEGTANFLISKNIATRKLHKMKEKKTPNPLEMLENAEIQIVINIPYSRRTRDDALAIRQAAVRQRILCVTTVAGTKALVGGLQELKSKDQGLEVKSLQAIQK